MGERGVSIGIGGFFGGSGIVRGFSFVICRGVAGFGGNCWSLRGGNSHCV